MNMNREPSAKGFSFDFGTKPTSVELEVVAVTIDSKLMLADYACAYCAEFQRRNPVRAETVGLTIEELHRYFEGLIALRVQSIKGDCKVWREAKQLLIPSWIEFVLSQIGEVVDVDRGLKLVPIFDQDVDISRMLETSDKLRAFMPDGISLHKDAFPRGRDGDPETMTMAILGSYVQSQSKDSHPISSYVAAFLGFKLKEEAAFKMLYRVRYDDINFIRAMLLREEAVY